MFVCWGFTFWLHLTLYQDGYQLLTVCIHGDFIVLPHWKFRPPARLLDTLHYDDTEPTSPFPILIIQSARLGNDQYQLCMSLF